MFEINTFLAEKSSCQATWGSKYDQFFTLNASRSVCLLFTFVCLLIDKQTRKSIFVSYIKFQVSISEIAGLLSVTIEQNEENKSD
jgi:hypothetical protein